MKKAIILITMFFVGFAINSQSFARHIKRKSAATHHIIHFIFCSDVHFGLTKPTFRGKENVSSANVNAAMVAEMNPLPLMVLPKDDEVGAGREINAIDAVIITGDICNRQEKGIQSAAASWKEFEKDYVLGLHLTNSRKTNTQLLLTPGNHDISDAIGYEKPMEPLIDKTSLVNIYNRMMLPKVAKSAKNYNHLTDKIDYSRDFDGIHLVFVDGWPDSTERIWLQKDLQTIPPNKPVLLFTHAMPDVEARFFTNPNGDHSINATDRFENLVNETFKDGNSTEDSAILEHRGLGAFLKVHPNIKAYFHGHTNYTEFYNWKEPENKINLPCFRVDSPMKGKYSAKDETKLSFELISIDMDDKKMTVRECLWNANPLSRSKKIDWGVSKTISLQ